MDRARRTSPLIEMVRRNKVCGRRSLLELERWFNGYVPEFRSQHLHKQLGMAAHRPVPPVLCGVEPGGDRSIARVY